jgi:SAM-dependent methyltransferase
MARIHSEHGDKDKPRIDRDEIVSFFERRAKRIATLGPIKAVIYQDKHKDLAERRDIAEKARVLPLLELDGSQELLDVGCGTGRWAEAIANLCASYHGIDISDGLIAYARERFSLASNCQFSKVAVDAFSLEYIGAKPFDRILCGGVLMYLNDDEVSNALRNFASASAIKSRMIIREPMAVDRLLTIKDHYSDDLEQVYNAIYRSQDELERLMKNPLLDAGFRIVSAGDVYEEDGLNNRAETRQRWMILER